MIAAGLRCCLIALLAISSATAWATGRDEIIINPNPDRTWNAIVGSLFTPGKSIAVVIAISNYIGEQGGGYAALRTASGDADKMVDFLIKDAGFDLVYVLTDDYATKEKIDKLMTDIIPGKVSPRDRFLFYWSGHGDQRVSTDGRRAFGFLPLKTSKSKEFSSMISMEDLQRWDRYLDARQALFVLDSCLSGLAGSETKAPRDARLNQLSLPARQLLTAGRANEKAISHERWGGSLFTDSFIRGAKGDAQGDSGVTNLFALLNFIQVRVLVEKNAVNWSENMTPQYRSLQAGDGAFFFTSESQAGFRTPTPIDANSNKPTVEKGPGTDEKISMPATPSAPTPAPAETKRTELTAPEAHELNNPSRFGSVAPFLKYPFVGKWSLQSKSGRMAAECDKVTPFTVFNDDTIRTPVGVLQLDEIRQNGDQWILRGHDKKTSAQWPRVVYKNITANSMTIETVGSDATCNLRRAAN